MPGMRDIMGAGFPGMPRRRRVRRVVRGERPKRVLRPLRDAGPEDPEGDEFSEEEDLQDEVPSEEGSSARGDESDGEDASDDQGEGSDDQAEGSDDSEAEDGADGPRRMPGGRQGSSEGPPPRRRGLRQRLVRGKPGRASGQQKKGPALRMAVRGLMRSPQGKAVALAAVAAAALLILLLATLGPRDDVPALGFAQPGELRVSADIMGAEDPAAGIPEDFLGAYVDMQARSNIPWGMFAAVGQLTTDHGRYSPYDDACPARDVLDSAAQATLALTAALSEANGKVASLSGAAEVTDDSEDAGAEGEEGSDAGSEGRSAAELAAAVAARDDLLVRLDTLVVRSSPEALGGSWRPCLVDRDPGRVASPPPGSPTVLPPWDFDPQTGAELQPPAGFVFDTFWWRWADVTDPDAPLTPSEGAPGRGPFMLTGATLGRDPSDLFEATRLLADRILLSVDAAAASGVSMTGAMLAGSPEVSDPFWAAALADIGVVTLLEDPTAGCADVDGPVAYLVETIWQCVLAQYDLKVVADVSAEGVPQVLPAADGADMLTAEALRVAAGFSSLGEDECDADDDVAGVFPLSEDMSTGRDRCDPAENILTAAELVAAAASTPLSVRSQAGTYTVMFSGWDAIPAALGDVEARERFAADGPFGQAREMSETCSNALLAAADESLYADDFPEVDAESAEFDLWFARIRFAQAEGCAGVPAADVERTLLRAFTGFEVHDEFGGDGSVSDEVLASRAEKLASYLSDRPAGPPLAAAVWGVDSFVPRLSDVELAWPAHPGRVLAEPKADVALGELVVPLMIRYGGTYVDDPRAGEWTVTLATFNRVSPVLPSLADLELLHATFDELSEGDAPMTASLLATSSGVPVAVAASYLAARRTVELSGVEATLQAVEVELYRVADSVVLAGVLVSQPVGGFVCPLGGRIVRQPNDWGFPRSNGRRHKGNDVFAPIGTPVVATRAFTVTAVSRVDTWFPGSRKGLGGLYVSYRDDRGDLWYNAHLHPGSIPDHVVRGYAGSAGEVIGHVGVSGNARDTEPHLHIERRPGGGGKVNPYPEIFPACAAQRGG